MKKLTNTKLLTDNKRLTADNIRLRKLLLGMGHDERKFVGSKRTKKKIKLFHRPECKWAKYLTDKSRQDFDSHEEAVAAGYKPCKTCKA